MGKAYSTSFAYSNYVRSIRNVNVKQLDTSSDLITRIRRTPRIEAYTALVEL